MQGYYRRADALVATGKIKEALSDYKRAVQLAPRDPDLRKKHADCLKQVKNMRMEELLCSESDTADANVSESVSALNFVSLIKLAYLSFAAQTSIWSVIE